MELEGAVEGLQDLAADVELHIPGFLLLLLFADANSVMCATIAP